MGKCPTCGQENAEGSNFCSKCGAVLTKGYSGDTTKVIIGIPEENLPDEMSANDIAAISALPPGSAMLFVLRGPNAGSRYLLNQDVVTVGRRPTEDIFLDDVTVSRQHARFVRKDGRFWLSDDGSLNGTYVNRTLIDGPVALRRNDEVQIGKFRMAYFSGTE